MSEELRRGILKGRIVGSKESTPEEREQHDRDFERILKEYGVMKEHESLKDWKKKSKV